MEKTGEPRFRITTKMEQKDYRKFLYIATFLRSKIIIPYLLLVSMAGAYLMREKGESSIFFIMKVIGLFILAVGTVCFTVERKNKQRVKTDRITFYLESKLSFFEDRVCYENEEMKGYWELSYDKIYEILESKDYFMFYLTKNQASLIRKQDMSDVENFQKFLKEKFPKKYKKI